MSPTIEIANPKEVQRLLNERHGQIGFFEAMTLTADQWALRNGQKAAIEAELLGRVSRA